MAQIQPDTDQIHIHLKSQKEKGQDSKKEDTYFSNANRSKHPKSPKIVNILNIICLCYSYLYNHECLKFKNMMRALAHSMVNK